MPFLMKRIPSVHALMTAMSGSSLRLLKKSGAITFTFYWFSNASTSFILWDSKRAYGFGFLRWWGEHCIWVEQQWMILARRQVSSSLFYSKMAVSRIRMLKFSWIPKTASPISHFSSYSRQLFFSMTAIMPFSRSAVKDASLGGMGRGLICSPVSRSTFFIWLRC